jgi:hypothetical protein
MEAFLLSLENTALSQWVLGSIRGYPIVLSFHSLGLGLLVGLLTIIALRILGFMPQQPLAPLRKFMPWVWLGFAVNLVSGVVLFMADAVKDFYSWTFWIKMLSIAVGIAFAVHASNTVLRSPVAETGPSQGTKVFAVVSLFAWLVAVVAGRLIAYLVYAGGT